MVKLLSQPFRLNPLQPGSLVYTDQGSDAQKGQEIATFLLTHKRERSIYQEFGIDDPSFNEFDETDVAANFATFYSTIELQSIEIAAAQAGVSDITIRYD